MLIVGIVAIIVAIAIFAYTAWKLRDYPASFRAWLASEVKSILSFNIDVAERISKLRELGVDFQGVDDEAKVPENKELNTISIEINMPRVIKLNIDQEELLSYLMYNRYKPYFLELVMTEKHRERAEGEESKEAEESKEKEHEEKGEGKLPLETLLSKGLVKEG